MKIAIVNDTAPSGHFGCKLVMDAIHEQFRRRGIEVIGTVPWTDHWRGYKSLLDQADLVVVNGEGSIHHGNRMELLKIAEAYPSVLINAVYQDVPENDYLKQFKYIAVRESFSKLAMEQHGVTPNVVPDLIFSHDIPEPKTEYGLCMVDSVTGEQGLDPHREDFISEMGKAERVCSGRFHAVCLAMLWGKPFAAYPSNTHKTPGMLHDAGALHLYKQTKEEALGAVSEFDASEYVKETREKIEGMFNNICDISPIEATVHLNTTSRKILNNIRLAKQRRLKEFEPRPVNGTPLAIAGGGPSLETTWPMLKDWPGRILATNGAHDYLIGRGVIPWGFCMMDARPENAEFVRTPRKEVIYFISSKCHPEVFLALKGHDVVLWHEQLDIGEPDDVPLVPVRTTVGLGSICLMFNAGFRQFHLFGMDSCYGDSHHAYTQTLNDGESTVMVTVGEQSFRCSPWMIHQAQEFKELLVNHGNSLSVFVHGGGLLAAIITEAQKLAHRKQSYAS